MAPHTPKKVDWLHVPKTGTSFLTSLLIYSCDYIAMYFNSSQGKDPRLVFHQEEARECVGQFIHEPLRAGASHGHKGYAVENVFTMLRAPTSRVASGFVHSLHMCFTMQGKKGMSHGETIRKEACEALEGGDLVRRASAEDLVVQYSSCVKHCQTNMIAGFPCQHSGTRTNSFKHVSTSLDVAKAKLARFAFVGLTDRWSETICLFGKLFPRSSGEPYPTDITNHNMRPSQNGTCEQKVEDVLHANPILRDYTDEALYMDAEKRFEKALALHPECKGMSSREGLILQ